MKQNKRVIMVSTSDLAAAITDGMQRFGCCNNFNLINEGSEDSPNWIAVEKMARGNAGMQAYEARINAKNAAKAKVIVSGRIDIV
ncbi:MULTISPECIES: hypothetical protein [Bacillus]|uniref:hypothetical protein n=1 Tax=Bacillus TaxID=1386 RepID=UPI00122CEF6F|nr:hypothetical protein [Bacillus cereus]KAA1807262.1 hypothetical protein FXB61_000128 [Bacillus cereus]HDR7724678.1 hypothetical protein [Bacillus cereus]